MNFIDNDIQEFDNYLKINTFNKFNIDIIYTKKSYRNFLTKTKNDIALDFNLKDKVLISSHQTHSKNVQIVNSKSNTFFENTDALITSDDNVAIVTKYADCLPIFIYYEEDETFGAIHSGWRGSFNKIVLESIEKLASYKKINLNKINILFGIGISCYNYIVDKNFYFNFKKAFSSSIIDKSFYFKEKGIFFDNQLFNYHLLKEFGLDPNKIFLNKFCTFGDDRFHSFRRDKDLSGRNGAIIYKK